MAKIKDKFLETAPGGGGGVLYALKTTGFSTTSTSLVTVTNFSLPVEANKTYLVTYDIKIRKTGDANEYAKLSFSIPSDSYINGSSWAIAFGTISNTIAFENATGGDKDIFNVSMPNLSVGMIRGNVIITTNDAGTLFFKLNTQEGTITLHTGSFITMTEI